MLRSGRQVGKIDTPKISKKVLHIGEAKVSKFKFMHTLSESKSIFSIKQKATVSCFIKNVAFLLGHPVDRKLASIFHELVFVFYTSFYTYIHIYVCEVYIYIENTKISATAWYFQTLLQLFYNRFHAFTTAIFRRTNSSFPTPLFIAYFLLLKCHMALFSRMLYTVLHIN